MYKRSQNWGSSSKIGPPLRAEKVFFVFLYRISLILKTNWDRIVVVVGTKVIPVDLTKSDHFSFRSDILGGFSSQSFSPYNFQSVIFDFLEWNGPLWELCYVLLLIKKVKVTINRGSIYYIHLMLTHKIAFSNGQRDPFSRLKVPIYNWTQIIALHHSFLRIKGPFCVHHLMILWVGSYSIMLLVVTKTGFIIMNAILIEWIVTIIAIGPPPWKNAAFAAKASAFLLPLLIAVHENASQTSRQSVNEKMAKVSPNWHLEKCSF